jgi:hypothetical protein
LNDGIECDRLPREQGVGVGRELADRAEVGRMRAIGGGIPRLSGRGVLVNASRQSVFGRFPERMVVPIGGQRHRREVEEGQRGSREGAQGCSDQIVRRDRDSFTIAPRGVNPQAVGESNFVDCLPRLQFKSIGLDQSDDDQDASANDQRRRQRPQAFRGIRFGIPECIADQLADPRVVRE